MRQNNCGQEVVRKLLAQVNSSDGYHSLIIEDECNNFSSISDVLEKYSITTEAVESDLEDIKKKEFPVIAQIKLDENRYHFIVIEKIIGRMVLYYEPNVGEASMSLQELKSQITNKFLLIREKNKKKNKMKTPSFISIQQVLILFFIMIFETFSNILIFLGIDDKNIFYLSYVGIVLFGISIVLHILMMMRLNKKIEKDYVFSPESSNYRKNIKQLFRVKNRFLLNLNIFLITFSSVFIFVFLQGIKDLTTLLIIFMTICITLICNVSLKRKRNYLRYKSLIEEKSFFLKPNDEEKYNLISKKNNQVVLYKYIGLLIGSTMLAVNFFIDISKIQEANLTYFLFYFGYSLVILTGINKLYYLLEDLFNYRKHILSLDKQLVSSLKKMPI